MKKVLVVALIALTFAACKKDKDENPANGGLLDRIVVYDGSDSTVGKFAYDPNNRLSEYLFISYSGGVVDSFRLNLTRDGAGRIVQMTQKESGYPQDMYHVTYNGTSSQLKSVVIDYTYDKDSFSYVYSGNGITQHSYYKSTGSPYQLTNRMEYVVQNGNIVSVKDFDVSGTMDSETTNTYDANKPAQLRTVEEVLITSFYELGMSNNITKSQTTFPSMPSYNEMITLTYTYAGSGQPLNAIVTGTSAGLGSIKYFYK